LEEDLTVYYRVDDFSEFPGVRKGVVQALERETMRKADLVVASAENLTRIGGEQTEARYLPHGVDYDHFSDPRHRDHADSPVKTFPSPRIGFFGLLSSWVDFDLIRRLAERNPEWSFVLVGPSQLHSSKLPQSRNIHYLGPVPYDELPRHANWFDVGLIPFKVNELTRSVNPLKLLEYFAMGIEVISSPLPEVLPLRPKVHVAADADGFQAAIDLALRERSEVRSEALRATARSCSWKAGAAKLRDWIGDELLKRGAGAARQS
jgi:glycosyltransferase involved in cell wall biosynthesis